MKCDRPPPGTGDPELPTKDVCSHCRHLGLTCQYGRIPLSRTHEDAGTFDYKPKKRGPPNLCATLRLSLKTQLMRSGPSQVPPPVAKRRLPRIQSLALSSGSTCSSIDWTSRPRLPAEPSPTRSQRPLHHLDRLLPFRHTPRQRRSRAWYARGTTGHPRDIARQPGSRLPIAKREGRGEGLGAGTPQVHNRLPSACPQAQW